MQQAILARVGREVDPDAWGEFANDGMAWLAAHLGAIRTNTGAVTSEGVGPLSRGYAALPLSAGMLSTSVYGVEYLRLLRIAVGVPGLVP